MIRALVTGSCGFIGGHLVKALLAKGYSVCCLTREPSDTRRLAGLAVQQVSGSFSDQESLRRAVAGMDYVFHAAAVISARDWETYRQANVLGTQSLLQACAESAPDLKKFVYISSISAAGPTVQPVPQNEEDECRPISLYGRSKLLAEKAAASFFERLPVVIIRPTNVLGPGQKELLAVIRLLRKRLFPLLGNGEKQTSLCFVQDLVSALIMAAESDRARSRTYYVSDGGAYSWREILEQISREFGHSFVCKIPLPLLLAVAAVLEIAARLGKKNPLITRAQILDLRKYYSLHDIGRIQKELGFAPQMKMKEGIHEIICWFKSTAR